MESTREQVLHLLQERGGATVAALAEALGVGQGAVRRHLDHLRLEKLVDVRVERHGVGRPAFVFYPTEQAEERTPAGYARLLARLSQGLSSLDAGQVRGRRGSQLLRQIYDEAAEQVAREHESDVAADSLAGRVAQTSQALRGEGIVDAWTRGSDGFRLTNSACPYRQVALGSQGPCELDRRAIELLIEAPVRQVSRIADGHAACEYVVADIGRRAKPEPPGAREARQAEA